MVEILLLCEKQPGNKSKLLVLGGVLGDIIKSKEAIVLCWKANASTYLYNHLNLESVAYIFQLCLVGGII